MRSLTLKEEKGALTQTSFAARSASRQEPKPNSKSENPEPWRSTQPVLRQSAGEGAGRPPPPLPIETARRSPTSVPAKSTTTGGALAWNTSPALHRKGWPRSRPPSCGTGPKPPRFARMPAWPVRCWWPCPPSCHRPSAGNWPWASPRHWPTATAQPGRWPSTRPTGKATSATTTPTS